MKKLVALCALVIFLLGCASTGWRGAAIGMAAVDTASTLSALHHGAQERNPVLTSSVKRIVLIQAAVVTAVWLLSKGLEPKQQAVVWEYLAAFHLGATAWNLGQQHGK